jgi:hypothetical protein
MEPFIEMGILEVEGWVAGNGHWLPHNSGVTMTKSSRQEKASMLPVDDGPARGTLEARVRTSCISVMHELSAKMAALASSSSPSLYRRPCKRVWCPRSDLGIIYGR